MIKNYEFIEKVEEYFSFLTTEFNFNLKKKEIRSNVFYDIEYQNDERIISISYENIEDYLLVIIFILQNGRLPNYDDKTKTLHLSELNKTVMSKTDKSKIISNNKYFLKFNTANEFESKILKCAKELRICLMNL